MTCPFVIAHPKRVSLASNIRTSCSSAKQAYYTRRSWIKKPPQKKKKKKHINENFTSILAT